jgi:hypothetical protein
MPGGSFKWPTVRYPTPWSGPVMQFACLLEVWPLKQAIGGE